MTITLFQFKPMFGLPSASPFCVKLETYLRMAGLDYTVSILKTLPKTHTGKAPYIEKDGRTLVDSGLIIDHLEQANGHPVDGRLTLAERGESLALRRLIEEHLYWVALYMRWVDPQTRQAWRPVLQELIGAPRFMMPFIARSSEKQIMRALRGQGLGRHPADVIWQFGIADVRALSHWLGAREWGFGDAPTVFDACLYAMIGAIIRTPWENPLKTATLKHGNLITHFERMLSRYFPEMGSGHSPESA
ncbi:MAG: glutathione S-transferase family protein [Rhodospirillaceae bacterium]